MTGSPASDIHDVTCLMIITFLGPVMRSMLIQLTINTHTERKRSGPSGQSCAFRIIFSLSASDFSVLF